jgi:hypothetical protein
LPCLPSPLVACLLVLDLCSFLAACLPSRFLPAESIAENSLSLFQDAGILDAAAAYYDKLS